MRRPLSASERGVFYYCPIRNITIKYDVRRLVEMTKEELKRESRPKKRRIRVVEDRDGESDPLRFVLGEYDVAAASDYNEGLRVARRQYFDLYVLYDHMPGGTGIELCLR